MKGLNCKVARAIVLAQCASDGGKGIHCDKLLSAIKGGYKYNRAGYDYKDYAVARAIRTIAEGGRKTGFRFFVTDGGSTPYLVYFSYRLNGRKRQISFHSFDGWLEKYKVSRRSGDYQVRWDEKNSRANCIELARYIKK